MPALISPCGGGSSPGTGSWVLLSRTTLASAGTIDVQNISQAYDDLVMVLIARGTRAAVDDFLQIRINNDSALSYDGIYSEGFGVSGATNFNGTFAQSSGRISGSLPANSASANAFGMLEITMPGYTSTTWNKVGYVLEGNTVTTASLLATGTGAFLYSNTAAVNRVTFFGGTTANLAIGSQLRIYAR